MNAYKVFSVKTATEMAKILSIVHDEDLRDRIIDAFDRADQFWIQHLEDMIGKEQTNIVTKYLEKDIPGVKD